jgi:cobalt-zinc-cadmium efflux system outer membrane protein
MNRIYFSLGAWTSAMLLVAAGCKGTVGRSERTARRDLKAVHDVYRPADQRPALPNLTTNSSFADFLTFAMLNQPQVEAAYYDWAASVEKITVDRSRPDPKLTFEAFIADTITSLMPGLMLDIPGPGKLGVRADLASAESRTKYVQFETSVLQAAFAVKKAYYPLTYLDEKIRVDQARLELLAGLEQLARSQNEVGKATLQDVLRAQIEEERLHVELANLEDSRRVLRARFRMALGLTWNDPDPPMPARRETSPDNVDEETLLAAAHARNPNLKAMEADLRVAEESLRLARKDKVPDFTAGFEVDAKSAPTIWNPQLSMTLPIWRDKLAAVQAQAQDARHAAEARLKAEHIVMAADFAEKSYDFREATRALASLRERLLPRARQSLEIARAAYLNGQLDFLNVTDAERTLFDLQLDEIAMETQRELALAELSLVIAGVPPGNAPLLPSQSETPTR